MQYVVGWGDGRRSTVVDAQMYLDTVLVFVLRGDGFRAPGKNTPSRDPE